MNRDELVERVAEAIYEATRESHQKPWADIATGVDVGPKLSTWFMDRRRAEARAALAIIEPEVREECAKVADNVGTPFGLISADNHHANGYRTAGREIAAAIRAGAKP